MKNFNMNYGFAGFAGAGLIFSIILKFVFQTGVLSFYSTLACFVVLLLVYHRLCYVAIVDGKYKDMGNGKRMTDGSIADSVYYLGFSYTLLILVTSFIAMGQDAGSTRLQYDSQFAGLMDILNKFCVGLFTTGYGLVARIQLSNLIEIEELDPEGLQERLNVKTAALIRVIENGTSSLTSLISSSNQTISTSVTDTTNSLVEKSNILGGHLTEMSENLSKILTKLKRQMTNLDLTDATSTIETHLLTTAKSVEGLNQGIDNLSSKFSNASVVVGDASQGLIGTMKEINSQYENLLNNLSVLSTSLNVSTSSFSSIDNALQGSNASVARFQTEINQSISQIERLNENLGISLNKLSDFSSATAKVQAGLQQGGDWLERSLGKGATDIEQIMRTLSDKINTLNRTLDDIRAKISAKY
ncbi:hypothetical protein G6675_04045 [Polynucleobacter paneuropaeus]|jgi:ferritin-like metal-binding protein YciE|nr:hypothetical protein [Polynucleobacter paneuropaeus]MBT8576018.1 hypothetical protein [Polynucleobacter paneuropaeus]MBT8587453.1 hypothetical protein [Polynucleobacter paneuropaeus]MBT8600121.1 hypothetical protein [Polynucleobacter paneuropaeus]MBT8604542.1 hypothetical protein [Polynucleobacter paneuropaeus]